MSNAEIRSKCPKCGEEGKQSITYKPSRSNPKRQYLTYIHSRNRRCFIGRIKNTDEVMGELNRPDSDEEYERAFKEIMKELRELADHYGHMKTSGSFRALVKRLRDITRKYGY
jgi:adenine-specific DNA methylase